MKNEAPQLKNEGIDLLKEEKEVKKEAMNGEKQKKEKHVKKGAAEDEKQEKVEQPWTDRERSIIVQHILTHVLANAGYGSIFRGLGGILARDGFLIRNTKAVGVLSIRHDFRLFAVRWIGSPTRTVLDAVASLDSKLRCLRLTRH